MKKTATVYWLLPANPQRDLFCNIVRILRKEFRAPNFEPHLTLLVTRNDRSSPNQIFKQIRMRPIRLKSRGVSFSDKFTKTLYLRFNSSPALRGLVTDLARATKTRAKPPGDPHVSLLYKQMSRGAKKEMASVLHFPFRTVIFDTIVAVRLTLPVKNGRDVDKWKIVARKSLRR